MVDHYWLSAAAKMIGRCIILVPTFTQSSTHIGRIIRVWAANILLKVQKQLELTLLVSLDIWKLTSIQVNYTELKDILYTFIFRGAFSMH